MFAVSHQSSPALCFGARMARVEARLSSELPHHLTLSKGKLTMSEITMDVMQKVTLYVELILLMFRFVLAALMYIVSRTSIHPITSDLNSILRAVPGQLLIISAYRHDTSESLLSLEQPQNTRKRRSNIRRLKSYYLNSFASEKSLEGKTRVYIDCNDSFNLDVGCSNCVHRTLAWHWI
jgi:hypothetical protein